MNRRLKLALVGAVLIAVVVALLWYRDASSPGSLTLEFRARSNGSALVLNQFVYDNPGGPGRVKVRDFQFFVSNVRLGGAEGQYVEPDSYHLLRFDNAARAFTIQLTGVPRLDYDYLEFLVGVDADANASIRAVGDLDPNGRMAWNWEVGYKFVLFEGGLLVDDVQIPLVYHVGFDDSARRVRFDLQTLFPNASDEHRVFDVDVMRLFDGDTTIDMQALSNVKFDRDDARRIATNFGRLIEYVPTPG